MGTSATGGVRTCERGGRGKARVKQSKGGSKWPFRAAMEMIGGGKLGINDGETIATWSLGHTENNHQFIERKSLKGALWQLYVGKGGTVQRPVEKKKNKWKSTAGAAIIIKEGKRKKKNEP